MVHEHKKRPRIYGKRFRRSYGSRGSQIETGISHKDPTYVVFDRDNDKWAYVYMKGWKANDRVDFDFRDAHDLDAIDRDEAYVKAKLRDRMKESKAVLVLIGPKTKNLCKYVRWELELAIELDVPIVAVNLNKTNGKDTDLCPAIIRMPGVACFTSLSRLKRLNSHWIISLRNSPHRPPRRKRPSTGIIKSSTNERADVTGSIVQGSAIGFSRPLSHDKIAPIDPLLSPSLFWWFTGVGLHQCRNALSKS
jgi:hypothetical protein